MIKYKVTRIESPTDYKKQVALFPVATQVTETLFDTEEEANTEASRLQAEADAILGRALQVKITVTPVEV